MDDHITNSLTFENLTFKKSGFQMVRFQILTVLGFPRYFSLYLVYIPFPGPPAENDPPPPISMLRTQKAIKSGC